MKIGFMIPHLKLFGGTRRIIEFANRLTEKRHDVTIYHSDGSPCEWMKCKAKIKIYKEVFNDQFDVIINTWAPFSPDLKNIRAKLKVFYILVLYKKWLLKKGIWINLLLFASKLYFVPRAKLAKVAFVNRFYTYLKNNLLKSKNSYSSIRRRKYSFLESFAHIWAIKKVLQDDSLKLSNSTWVYQWLKKELGINSILLIGGVNFEMFHPVESKNNPDEFRVLCSGDPRERKGTKTVFEAVEIAKKEEPRIILDTYYGRGIPQEKMAKKYSSADIFVDAQWQAGWNNPVAEAMACKVPAVCTDIGGVKDFAFHEKTALLVPPKNPDAMASAILKLIRDEKLREALRENAYHHIRQFDWGKSVKRLEEILSSELNRIEINQSFTGERIIEGKTPSRIWDDHIARYRFAGKYIKGKEVLDISCGTGYGTKILYGAGASKVIGVDISIKAIDFACAKYKINGLEFKVGNILNIDFPRDSFDVITCYETIEHIQYQERALMELQGILKPNGLLIISSPNRKLTSPGKSINNLPDNPFHAKEYLVREFISVLGNYFEILEVYGQRAICKWFFLPFFERIMRKFLPMIYNSEKGKPELEEVSLKKEYRYITIVCKKSTIDKF